MPLQILLATVGSAGDVYPVISLGRGLRARGHRPVIMANAHFQSLATGAGLGFIPLGTAEAYERLVANPDLWHPSRGFQVLVREAIAPYIRPLVEIVSSFDPAETVIAASGFLYGARIAHEKLGTPYVTLHLQPALFRSAYDTPAMGSFFFPGWWPRWLKRLYFRFLDAALVDRAIAPHVNPVRAEWGLPPQRHFIGDCFHAPQASIGLFPDWFAPPQPDWPAQIRLTGFIHDEGEPEELPAAAQAFLAAGDPPLVFTAGTAMRHGERFFAAAVAAAQQLGRRSLLLTRHRQQLPPSLPPGVQHFDYLPFRQLLPHAAALISHGGIGTLAQGLAAGIPQLLMPMSHDQPDNARRLQQLGAGSWLSPRDFTGRAVARQLAALLDSRAVRSRCRVLAQRIDFSQAMAASAGLVEAAAGAPIRPG
jgi:rhamnosyltransferase subunit B